MSEVVVGILALQGDFQRHGEALGSLGVRTREVRRADQLNGLSGLVLPGGESTTILRLLDVQCMFDPLRDAIVAGVPVLATCGGLILLAESVEAIWVGGGRTFAAKPRDFSQKVNKKMYKSALRSILSELIRQDRLVVTDSIEMKAPKTKELASRLKKLDLDSVLIVNEAFDEKVYLSARNLANVGICDAASVDPVVLMRFEKVLMTLPALKMIEERLS